MQHTLITFICTLALLSARGAPKASSALPVVITREAVSLRPAAGVEVLRYRLVRPADTKIESAAFFHPFTTPRGSVVTDLAPSDHPHHGGIFIGWVEMHGEKDADFWGWGQHAPIKDRRIVNQSVRATRDGLNAVNNWMADETVLIQEKLRASLRASDEANVLDLNYVLTPKSDITLSRWAFSGFCLRTRKDGKLQFYSPQGEVTLPNPSHVKPESDWPDAPWYAATVTLADGTKFTSAVINHPKNPPSLWHNHRDVRMINPAITAPNEVKLKRGKPLVLLYRVVAVDGGAPMALLNRLADEFQAAK